jgi:protein TonB
VERLELHASSGFPRLDQAATSAVRHWTFVPARRGTEPVSAWVLVPLTFTLDA